MSPVTTYLLIKTNLLPQIMVASLSNSNYNYQILCNSSSTWFSRWRISM